MDEQQEPSTTVKRAEQVDPLTKGTVQPSERGGSPPPPGRYHQFRTVDGTIWLDTSAKTVKMKGQGGSVLGSTANVDSAGSIDKRITATRIVLTGPLALAWQKKKDNRELYLLVDGVDYSLIAQVDPKKSVEARRFAAAINTASRGGTVLTSSFSGTSGATQQKKSTYQENLAKENARRAALSPERRAYEDKRRIIIAVVVLAVIALLFLYSKSKGH